jgi:hypothetical protein
MTKNILARFLALNILILSILAVTFVSPPRVVALDTGQTLEVTLVPIASVLTTAAAGYLYYKNRYSQPRNAKGELGYRGPGEFFVGGFLGAGAVPKTAWDYRASGLGTAPVT